MKQEIDVIALASRLIQYDTINPPGNELPCAQYLADILQQAGFDTRLVPLGDRRASLVATKGSAGKSGPLVFTGHIDVVPLGAKPWVHAPFAGEIVEGRLYGRGSSDMKGGVAAMVAAAVAQAGSLGEGKQVTLLITAAEETGCQGAEAIIAAGMQGTAGALIVGEPTANVPYLGHKGALWLRGTARGITAHGAMPEKGDNAIYKAARAACRLSCFHFHTDPHPALGAPTVNVGTLHGGLNINSVPDRAVMEIDVRTVPGMEHADVRQQIVDHMQEPMEVETIIDLPSVWTSPKLPWVRRAAAIASRITGESFEVRTASYFSDAALLAVAFGGAPTLILGPGEPAQAHQTDEWCAVAKIEQCAAIYSELIRDWDAAHG